MISNSRETQACHFIKNVVAMRAEDAERAREILDGEQLGESQLVRLMGGETDKDVLGQLQQLVGVFRVKGDPHENAAELREGGVAASPIHALGSLNHISSMTGTDPKPARVRREPVLAASSPGRIVAAVDTGVTANLPGWLESGLEYDPADIETLGGPGTASHGTFVAGLIRRIAPEHTISLVRARRWSVANLAPKLDTSHDEADDPTTELHVLEAMLRLVNRLRGKDPCEVAALNLSLGGSCADHDPGFTSLSIALDLWRNSFPGVPIFAAGGNTSEVLEVYPGAFEYIRSVAAARDGGDQVVWDRGRAQIRTVVAPDRHWITDVAPGADLVSPSGRTKREWVKWSGSSFATAVATASHVSRRHSEVNDGLMWWSDPQTRAGDIAGLVI